MFDFLTLKYVKVLLLQNRLVPKYNFFLKKYFFDDAIIRMLKYTHFK